MSGNVDYESMEGREMIASELSQVAMRNRRKVETASSTDSDNDQPAVCLNVDEASSETPVRREKKCWANAPPENFPYGQYDSPLTDEDDIRDAKSKRAWLAGRSNVRRSGSNRFARGGGGGGGGGRGGRSFTNQRNYGGQSTQWSSRQASHNTFAHSRESNPSSEGQYFNSHLQHRTYSRDSRGLRGHHRGRFYNGFAPREEQTQPASECSNENFSAPNNGFDGRSQFDKATHRDFYGTPAAVSNLAAGGFKGSGRGSFPRGFASGRAATRTYRSQSSGKISSDSTNQRGFAFDAQKNVQDEKAQRKAEGACREERKPTAKLQDGLAGLDLSHELCQLCQIHIAEKGFHLTKGRGLPGKDAAMQTTTVEVPSSKDAAAQTHLRTKDASVATITDQPPMANVNQYANAAQLGGQYNNYSMRPGMLHVSSPYIAEDMSAVMAQGAAAAAMPYTYGPYPPAFDVGPDQYVVLASPIPSAPNYESVYYNMNPGVHYPGR